MIKLFEDFSGEDRVIHNLRKIGIVGGYEINDDLTVDVSSGNGVYIKDRPFKKLPVKFNKINNWFVLENNGLVSLEGCPIEVGKGFACKENLITSLEGCPTITNGGSFNIYSNRLTSLVGSPKVVKQMYCDNNRLINLKGSPEIVNGTFNCGGNPITSLSDGPKFVEGDYSTTFTNIHNLDGFDCSFKGIFECIGTPLNEIFPLNGMDNIDISSFKVFKSIKEKTVNLRLLKYAYSIFGISCPDNLEELIIENGYEII